MATIPTPRSPSQILADMIGTTVSRVGLPSLAVGNPVLSILEAAARSDARQAQDIFNLLNSVSLDNATGQALDRIGADENVQRIPETASGGVVTISDSSFEKIESRIFQGKPAPNIGSAVLYVQDATDFPASGDLYIGRGTPNVEGPLVYTSKVNSGGYWTINLDVGSYTQKYHNIGESVILAQGGIRTIPAGTVVQTSQGNTSVAVQFGTLFAANIPDGETEVANIQVVCRTPGVGGNVIAGSVNSFASAPFTGAAVTNPLPFTNGLATEQDEAYRERIRQARASRSRGTALAIKTGVIGLTSTDENRRILSASVLTREGYPTTLYIDDGTGYEAKDSGVAYEVVVDQALGGEQYLQLTQGRPVAKAYVKTELEAPYVLVDGAMLSVKVGGVLHEHSFGSTQFRNIANASAYEVAASINSNSAIQFQARTSDNGTKVVIFAKGDTNEDVEVVSSVGDDANDVLVFAAGRTDTLRLYKNDRLLNKDGLQATIISNSQGLWGTMASGETLILTVDGVSLGTIIFTDADFVNAGTPYLTLSQTNSLQSWVDVIHYKVPGVTAAATGGKLTLTSNLGRSDRASLSIDAASTLVINGMFAAETVTGKSLDYTFDRNLGQIRLDDSQIAVTGDSITAGSVATRAFLESDAFTSITFTNTVTSVSGQNGAEAWFVVDGDAQIVPVGGSPMTWSVSAQAWGDRITITAPSSIFSNVQVGDWVIFTDTAQDAANRGVWRIVIANPTNISIERPTGVAVPETVTISSGGISVVRTSVLPQRAYIPFAGGAVYTATSIAASINTQLAGATAYVYRTNQVRVRTNRFALSGDIALVATNTEGARLGLPLASAIDNETSHLAVVEAGEDAGGTPSFQVFTTSSTPSLTNIIVNSGLEPDYILRGLKPISTGADPRYGNLGYHSAIEVMNSATDIVVREEPLKEWTGTNRFYGGRPYDFSSNDEVGFLIDGDTSGKRFVAPLFRRLTPTTSSYGITNTFTDKDNADLSLAKSFGIGMDWTDFAVHMKARTKSHRIGGVDTTQTILWRYYRLGPEGNSAYLRYVYPTAPSQNVRATIDNTSTLSAINVSLSSGAARTGYTVRNSTYVGVAIPAGPSSALYTKWYVLNLPISAGVRKVNLGYTAKVAGWTVGETVTGAVSGATGVIDSVVGGAPGGASGTIVLTGGNNIVFQVGEALNGSVSGAAAATALGPQQVDVTRLTLTLPGAVTGHGLQVGDKVWVQSTDVNFPSGQKTLVNVNNTGPWIEYYDATPLMAAGGAIGTVSKDANGQATLSGSTIINGDMFRISNPSFGTAFTDTVRITTLNTGSVSGATPVYPAPTPNTTLTWVQLSDTSYLQAFPLNATNNAITAIASTVNAQADSPCSAVAVGDGVSTTGVISYATYEAVPDGLGTTAPVDVDGISAGYHFVDGINFVRSHTTPPNDTTNFTFTFKTATDATLATNSDWTNESIRIVPMTSTNVVDYLNTAGPGGLFANSEITSVNSGWRPQVATLEVGASGSVQVQGGDGNGLLAPVQGHGMDIRNTQMGVNVASVDSDGLCARHWVKVQNNVAMTKDILKSTTTLSSISGSTVVIGTDQAWTWATTAPGAIVDKTWQIEKQGNFVCFTYVSGGAPTLTGVQEGDVVHVSKTKSGGINSAAVNSRNTGFFRIVRISTSTNTFWIENPNVLEETTTAQLSFLKWDSALPGDMLSINSSVWGAGNVGEWTISSLALETLTGVASNLFTFSVVGSMATQGAVGALGANAGLVRINEGAPSRLYKLIANIEPNSSNFALSFVKFSSNAGVSKVSEAAGSYLQALDKLAFSTSAVRGIDGYRYHTGLIAEANKVAYGLESDPQQYPGIVAAGARVNIEGPLVRRLQVSLAVRAKTGFGLTEIKNQIRSAVAAFINESSVGTPIAISDLVSAAVSVNGVSSVSVISPTYAPGTDMISVQPYEKPLVLSLDEDVLISFIGD